MKHVIVEVSVNSTTGGRIPVGLMNTEQALSLPEEIDIEVSHPEQQAGDPEIFLDRAALRDHIEMTSCPSALETRFQEKADRN